MISLDQLNSRLAETFAEHPNAYRQLDGYGVLPGTEIDGWELGWFQVVQPGYKPPHSPDFSEQPNPEAAKAAYDDVISSPSGYLVIEMSRWRGRKMPDEGKVKALMSHLDVILIEAATSRKARQEAQAVVDRRETINRFSSYHIDSAVRSVWSWCFEEASKDSEYQRLIEAAKARRMALALAKRDEAIVNEGAAIFNEVRLTGDQVDILKKHGLDDAGIVEVNNDIVNACLARFASETPQVSSAFGFTAIK